MERLFQQCFLSVGLTGGMVVSVMLSVCGINGWNGCFSNAFCRWLFSPVSLQHFTQVKVIESRLYNFVCVDNVTTYDCKYLIGFEMCVATPAILIVV